ncbi:2-oxo acid dehydrogenase subunit E2 [Buchnera aphidicola (Chaitoregma tattakana)]|uniref:2-oxo acid dehydrogenase subunit E2 n=1 Tax=Buchnera aphidicola TaxID=9 RepID=UPI0031B8A934
MYKIVKIPDVGKEELEIIDILVKVGDVVKKKQEIIVIEGDKTSIEVPSHKDGIVKEIFVSVGDKVKSNNKILLLKTKFFKKSKIPGKNNNILVKNKKTLEIDNLKNNEIYATPIVRKLARENNVNLEEIKGTGIKGRISKEDFENFLEKKSVSHIKHEKSEVLDEKFNFKSFGPVDIIKLSKIQNIVSKNLCRSWSIIPHVTQFDEIDITDIEKFRKNVNLEISSEENKSNYKITLLPFIVKVIGLALKKFPNFNSSYYSKTNTLFLKKYINVGVVINSNRGIFIPVIKDILQKSIFKISKNISCFSQKVRDDSLNIKDIIGGNFTISNLGGYGSHYFTPIINHPEVAILGISKYINKIVLFNKKVTSRTMLPISLSYDHRVINGVESTNFINFIKNKLEKFYYFLIK